MSSSRTGQANGQRVAVVGLGSAGTTLHLPALAGISGVTLVGVADPDERQRNIVSSKYGVLGFAGMDEMLEQVSPDVVIVATPPALHAEQCLSALRVGAHVICEKPFVASLAEADRVILAAQSADRQVALNHEFREMPVFKALRDHVASQDVLLTQVWQLIDMPTSREVGWRGSMSHRTLFEAGVHLLDFVIALYGELPRAVSATTTDSGAHGNASDAVVLVTLTFSNGRVAQLVQSRISKGARQYFEVRVDTAEASWRASFGGRARITAGLHRSTTPRVRIEYGVSGMAWREVGDARTVVARNPKDPGMLATRAVLEHTFAAFRNGTEPYTSAQRARDILAVTVACYTSSHTGQRVDLTADRLRALVDVQLGQEHMPTSTE